MEIRQFLARKAVTPGAWLETKHKTQGKPALSHCSLSKRAQLLEATPKTPKAPGGLPPNEAYGNIAAIHTLRGI